MNFLLKRVLSIKNATGYEQSREEPYIGIVSTNVQCVPFEPTMSKHFSFLFINSLKATSQCVKSYVSSRVKTSGIPNIHSFNLIDEIHLFTDLQQMNRKKKCLDIVGSNGTHCTLVLTIPI
jgi:hypothetical protein